MPILLGVVAAYVVAALVGEVDFASVVEAPWIGLPVQWDSTVFSLFGANFDAGLALTAVITIMPLALATMIEHIGDVSAISSTCNRNYIAEPGLHRTLLGDGLATILASLFGAPANTTYGENTGVLALTRVFDPRVIRIAACFAIVFSFCPKFEAVIGAMPACVIGGVSLVLYGMISAVGIRNLVENHVDFMKSRNVLVTALILVLSLGIAYSAAGAIVIPAGAITISLSGLAVGSLVGIVLNMVLPGKDGDEAETHQVSELVEEEPEMRSPARRDAIEGSVGARAISCRAQGSLPAPVVACERAGAHGRNRRLRAGGRRRPSRVCGEGRRAFGAVRRSRRPRGCGGHGGCARARRGQAAGGTSPPSPCAITATCRIPYDEAARPAPSSFSNDVDQLLLGMDAHLLVDVGTRASSRCARQRRAGRLCTLHCGPLPGRTVSHPRAA